MILVTIYDDIHVFIHGINTLRYSHASVVYCIVISSHTLHSLSICSLSCPQYQMNISNILIHEGTLPGVLNHFFKHRKIGLSVFPTFLYQAAAQAPCLSVKSDEQWKLLSLLFHQHNRDCSDCKKNTLNTCKCICFVEVSKDCRAKFVFWVHMDDVAMKHVSTTTTCSTVEST